MKIYCISGLGVDERAFDNIVIPEAEMFFVDWIPPKKGEDLTSYAKRLFQIENPDSKSIYVGVSFGGMIAQEWAKLQTPEKLILISTTHDSRNIKSALRIPGKLGMYHLLHPKIALICAPVTFLFFSVKSKRDKEMLKNILRDTDPKFFRWATGALLRWKTEFNSNAICIHGKKDTIIAPPSTLDFETNGGHFTIYSQGNEISDFLSKHLA
ncbi:MAG: hypothetical protein Crog4KO_23750 [Crocinitomicaceae bacterium]